MRLYPISLKTIVLLGISALAMAANIRAANAEGADSYLGEVLLVAGTYCPAGTVESQGQILPIDNSNAALFSLFGSAYGGDGRQTFALPDLREKAPVKGARWCLVTSGIFPPRSAPALPPYQPTPAVRSEHELFLGQVITVANTFCPYGTVESKGQMLNIAENDRLFSLLGTTYGGDGTNSFALPDLSDEAPVPALRWCLVMSGMYPMRPR